MSNTKKIALITGANRGLGFETARQLGSKDVKVLVAARTKEKAEAAAQTLAAEGLDVEAVQLDVTNDADIATLASHIEQTYGRLDILVNNAGIMQEKGLFTNTTLDVSIDDLRTTFETNFIAPVKITRALLPLLKKSEAGRIVNLSSILGSIQENNDPNSMIYEAKAFAYNSSKTALNAFTVHLAHALKDTNIKVNSVHPGWVKTDMGSEQAPMEIPDGAKTSVELATIGADGPNARFLHLGQEIAW